LKTKRMLFSASSDDAALLPQVEAVLETAVLHFDVRLAI